MKETNQEKWLKRFGAENTYNKHCKHLGKKDDKYVCTTKMDMLFCGNNCAFASNNKLSTKVKKRGGKNG